MTHQQAMEKVQYRAEEQAGRTAFLMPFYATSTRCLGSEQAINGRNHLFKRSSDFPRKLRRR
ncbi:hypothetical protein O9929_05985 [Vibrio lentus]|nr:hypothetical protein [Vibrio lentus]